MRKEILPAWRGRELSSIGKAEIHGLLDPIFDRAPIVANRVLAWFWGMCNFAVARGLIAINPCTGIAMPSAEVARDRVLSEGELTALLAAASCLSVPYGTFIVMLILTGQRSSEVAGMAWREVDLQRKVWVLPKERAKNKIEHTIPLSELAISVLAALPRFASGDFVFSINGKAPIRGFLKRNIDKLMPPDTAPWVLHDLRRTVATGLAKLGVQLPVVEKLLNHVSGSFAGIVGVYQRHDYAEQKRTAMELWSRRVKTIVTGEEANNTVPMRHGK